MRRNEVSHLRRQPQCLQYFPNLSTLVNCDRLISRYDSTPYITRESSSIKAVSNEMPHLLFYDKYGDIGGALRLHIYRLFLTLSVLILKNIVCMYGFQQTATYYAIRMVAERAFLI